MGGEIEETGEVMTNQASKSGESHAGSLTFPRTKRDILIVGSPIIVMGIVGNVVGGATLVGGALINLGYLAMILVGAKLLQNQGSSWRRIGLSKPGSWLRTAVLGIATFLSAVILFVAVQAIAAVLLNTLGMAPSELDQSRFNPIVGNVSLFGLMVVLAWTTIAFGEELFYRAFLITRMVDFSNMSRGSAILIAGIIFGAVHFAEGLVGILANASFGILFGWVFVRSSRNLWITIIGHGLMNTLRFALLFVGAA